MRSEKGNDFTFMIQQDYISTREKLEDQMKSFIASSKRESNKAINT